MYAYTLYMYVYLHRTVRSESDEQQSTQSAQSRQTARTTNLNHKATINKQQRTDKPRNNSHNTTPTQAIWSGSDPDSVLLRRLSRDASALGLSLKTIQEFMLHLITHNITTNFHNTHYDNIESVESRLRSDRSDPPRGSHLGPRGTLGVRAVIGKGRMGSALMGITAFFQRFIYIYIYI